MNHVLVDTNVFIDHERGRSHDLIKCVSMQQKGIITLHTCSVTSFEYLTGLESAGQDDPVVLELFSLLNIIPFTPELARQAAAVNRQHRLYERIGLADIIIATTAIHHDMRLLTNNHRHFDLIPEVQYFTIPS